MRIGLVGWGVETKSAYNYFGDEHEYFIVNEEPRDDFPKSENVATQTLDGARKPGLSGNATDLSYLKGIENCDKIVYSPSSRKNLEELFDDANDFWSKATTILHIFFERIPKKNIIAVTGTKGKGTTTSLIAEILKESGETVHVGGNIGRSVLEIIPEFKDGDWVVLELSSFQLYKFPYSPHVAVHLMMIPEHIDEWHLEMEDYVEAKRNIVSHQSPEDITVFLPSNKYSSENASFSDGVKIPYTESPGAHLESDSIVIDGNIIAKTSEVKLLGNHNLENICAAITASWQITQNVDAIKRAITSFGGLEHRLQVVREVNGVKFVNDSFGTTPDTAIVAMDSFNEQKVMIVGGHDKGSDYRQMIARLNSDDIEFVVCLGITGQKIATELVKLGFSEDKIMSKNDYNDWNMREIVDLAISKSIPGSVVLLSTGSASFGIFKDYKERGNQFIDVVNSL